MPLTQAQLSAAIKAAMDAQSNSSEINPAEARQQEADAIAAAIAAFVQGRAVVVIGVQPGGGTANGIVQ